MFQAAENSDFALMAEEADDIVGAAFDFGGVFLLSSVRQAWGRPFVVLEIAADEGCNYDYSNDSDVAEMGSSLAYLQREVQFSALPAPPKDHGQDSTNADSSAYGPKDIVVVLGFFFGLY